MIKAKHLRPGEKFVFNAKHENDPMHVISIEIEQSGSWLLAAFEGGRAFLLKINPEAWVHTFGMVEQPA